MLTLKDFRCTSCGHEYEDLVDADEISSCPKCPGVGKTVILTAPRLDPNMDTPDARAEWRRQAERRGRGADMTAANKTVEDEGLRRKAHQERADRGENPIITS